jgi:hypothetical protein
MIDSLPDPHAEIRVDKLQTLRGPNVWALRPVTRMDITIGEFEDRSSADIAGLTERLVGALPGLVEHRCSIGARGGFVTRLRRGTYAGHIIEHIAIELQRQIGHEVGFGRTRGTGEHAGYSVVFEHRHAGVGLRAAQLALDVLRDAITGSMGRVDLLVAELSTLSGDADVPELSSRVRCAITGGGDRRLVREMLVKHGIGTGDEIVDVHPVDILEAGLPFRNADMAVLLDAEPQGVPDRFTEHEHAVRLVTVLSDVVVEGGVVIAPAAEREVQERALEHGRVLGLFGDRTFPERARRLAIACAVIDEDRIRLEAEGESGTEVPLDRTQSAEAQAAAALCVLMERLRSRVSSPSAS